MPEYGWRIMQDVGGTEMAVAGGSCHDPETCDRELSHYAMLYAEEGPIRIEARTGNGKWKACPITGFGVGDNTPLSIWRISWKED